MKKIIMIFLFLLCSLSIGFGIYNYTEFDKYDKKIVNIKKDIKDMQENIKDEEKLKKESEEKYSKFMEENKDKIEEINKWQEETKKVKDLL